MIKKLMAWFVGKTKAGKAAGSAQGWLKGKKAYLAGAALALPAIIAMLNGFVDQGLPYLMSITNTPEFAKMMEGFSIMALRAGISKAKGN